MALKYKNVYIVWTCTKYGISAQPVKGNNVQDARKRFKKRYPKMPIHSVNRLHGEDRNTTLEPI